MKITQTFITKNDCYKVNRKITPKGIMVHSTATPGVMASAWFSRWNKSGIEKAVHAFVDDKEVCQHLPWDHRAWHCGAAGNNTHISFEMCEPKEWKTDEAYFKKCYANAVELAAYLCKMYKLKASDIISHKEGASKGIASNHGDPEHWWTHFGYTMNNFRQDVQKALNGGSVNVQKEKEVLHEGARGEAVRELQTLLNKKLKQLPLKYSVLSVDGAFGTKTLEAVKEFQKQRKLSVDGIVGKQTWDALAVNYGDVDGDGKITAADALKILKSSVGKQTLTADQKKKADIDADGKITAADAQKVLKKSVDK